MSRPRVLVVAGERLGGRMAGPAIRALELARALSAECAVTVAAPPGSALEGVDAALVLAGPTEQRALLAVARAHDVVLVQQAPPQLLLALAREPVRIVADLYTPLVLEALEAVRGQPPGAARRVQRLAARQTLATLAAADLVLCASERQRDLWLGAMAVSGLLDLDAYAGDPSLRALVAVVPFGVPAGAPQRGTAPVLKGVRPGIAADHRVLLWGGGIWRWLDALTPIRAVERLRAHRDDVHLVFLGAARPSAVPADVPSAAAAAIACARERGLLDRSVHVLDGWVPYAERGRWLAEADVGVTAHHDHVETRFAFRTRILDYLWAGLPVVGTTGDALTDRLEAGVGAGDDIAFAAALEQVLDAGPERDAARARSRALATELAWERSAAPLLAFCRGHAERPRRRRHLGVLTRATLAQYPDSLARTWRTEGPGTAARRVARNAGRLMGRAG